MRPRHRQLELRMMAYQAVESQFALQEAEARFRNIADCAPVLIICSPADGTASFVNRTWLEFTGRTLEQEVGEGFVEMFHPDYRESIMQAANWEAFRARKPPDPGASHAPRRREYRWMLTRGMPRLRDDGTYAGYIGCFTDVTEQRRAVLNLEKQCRCTAAVAEASGALYFILDKEGRIEQGTSLCACQGVSEPGRFLWEACDAATSDIAGLRDAVQHAASGREPSQARAAEMMWTFTPVQSDRDEFIALVAIAKEVGVADSHLSPRAPCSKSGCCTNHEPTPVQSLRVLSG